MNLDDVHAKFPHLSLTLYMYAGQPVTLECIATDGSIYKFEGATEHDAVMAGFGDDLTEKPTPAPTTSIFD